MLSESVNQPISIAVLPFENLSGQQEDDYFSIGFVEDLITDLAHFPSLHVIASHTSQQLGAGNGDTVAIAQELAIHYLLKGNLRRQGEMVRLNTQLLDTDPGSILWAERYDAPVETIFDIQDDIVAQVVAALSAQIDKNLLAAARNKPITSLAAYDCWLRGMDHLRKGTSEADAEARRFFEQALEIDPHYSRAYAGLSLSYFNEWSCQLWEKWESVGHQAYKYAAKALRMDDTDHVVQMVMGRLLLYRREFELAEQHIDRSLALNSNDADTLAQIATSMAFLGKGAEGEQLFKKAMRLNPYRNIWYYIYGAFTYFVQGRFRTSIELALKGPLTEVWVDQSAYLAAAYAHLGKQTESERYLAIFRETFQEEITAGRPATDAEIVNWIALANPFKQKADLDRLLNGLAQAGLDATAALESPVKSTPPASPTGVSLHKPPPTNVFVAAEDLWQMRYQGTSVQLSGVKGFHDLARLLAQPGRELHCTELMGLPVRSGEEDLVLDGKARQAYEQRIRDLQEGIAEAEDINDLGRRTQLNRELAQLTDHLTKALGLGGRTRKLNAPAERARAAVTWRIRSAIRKIDAVHPVLGRHLTHSIRTGTFCSYTPETPHQWDLSSDTSPA